VNQLQNESEVCFAKLTEVNLITRLWYIYRKKNASKMLFSSRKRLCQVLPKP